MIRTECRLYPAPAVVRRELHLHDGAVTTEGDALNPHRQPGRQLAAAVGHDDRSEEHTSELQSQSNLVCRLLLEKKKKTTIRPEPLSALACASRRPALVLH